MPPDPNPDHNMLCCHRRNHNPNHNINGKNDEGGDHDNKFPKGAEIQKFPKGAFSLAHPARAHADLDTSTKPGIAEPGNYR